MSQCFGNGRISSYYLIEILCCAVQSYIRIALCSPHDHILAEMTAMFKILNRVPEGALKMLTPIGQYLRQQGTTLMTEGPNNSKSPVQLIQVLWFYGERLITGKGSMNLDA